MSVAGWGIRLEDPRVVQFESAVLIAGVLLRRLNIAPSPIANK